MVGVGRTGVECVVVVMFLVVCVCVCVCVCIWMLFSNHFEMMGLLTYLCVCVCVVSFVAQRFYKHLNSTVMYLRGMYRV